MVPRGWTGFGQGVEEKLVMLVDQTGVRLNFEKTYVAFKLKIKLIYILYLMGWEILHFVQQTEEKFGNLWFGSFIRQKQICWYGNLLFSSAY